MSDSHTASFAARGRTARRRSPAIVAALGAPNAPTALPSPHTEAIIGSMTSRVETMKALAIRHGDLARLHLVDPTPERATELARLRALMAQTTAAMGRAEHQLYSAWMRARAESAASRRQ